MALVKGNPAAHDSTSCRVHSGALIADVFGSGGADGRQNLRHALEYIERQGHGVLVYLPPKTDVQAEVSALRSRLGTSRSSPSHPPADAAHPAGPPLREFGLGAQILQDLGLHRIHLLSNHPRRIAGIEAYGLEVLECVPLGHDRDGSE
jgi:3,4-dihydroxy 2-butanone 4-phosphate synthase/GTP cyclohydrolase II